MTAAALAPEARGPLVGALSSFDLDARELVELASAVDAIHRPDAQLKIGTDLIGDNVYNSTGVHQTGTIHVAPGRSGTVRIRFQKFGSGA